MNDKATKAPLQPGYVDIRGVPYKTVAKRVLDFRNDHTLGGGWGIVTEILHNDPDGKVCVKASIIGALGLPVAVGHAEEDRSLGGNINTTSALENCETSAIGRALAAAGYGGHDFEYASAEEMRRAVSIQETMEDGKMAPVKMREYVEAMNKCVEQDDGPGLVQLTDELTQAQQLWIWNQFRSYERKSIKDLLRKARGFISQSEPSDKDYRRQEVRNGNG